MLNGELRPLPGAVIELTGFDLVITAIGSRADAKINDNRIIYAGDCKHGGSTIVEALASGRDAARLLDDRLSLAAE